MGWPWQRKEKQAQSEPVLEPLSDRQYEQLFLALLKDVEEGRSLQQLQARLGGRQQDSSFVSWLRRFGRSRLENPAAHVALGQQMVALAEVELGPLSVLSGEIGKQLLTQDAAPRSEALSDEPQPAQVIDEETTTEEITRRADFYFQQGKESYYQGDLRGAITAYNKALDINPYLYGVLVNKGVSLAQLGLYDAALVVYNQALGNKPDDYIVLTNKGGLLAKLGNYEAAITLYNQALTIESDDYVTLYNKGIALVELGQYEEAIAIYDQVLETKTDLHEVFYNKGIALASSRQYEAAIAAYDQSLEIKPDKRSALVNKGIALANLGGQYEAAIMAFDQALSINPDDHGTWINRGVAVSKSIRCNTSITFSLPALLRHESLDKRGYEGRIACYTIGLRHVHKDKDPEGWGLLHHEKGRAHYFHSRSLANASIYLAQATDAYGKALATLTAFPTRHLAVCQDAIRAYLGLNKAEIANQYREEGLQLFRQLLNEAPTLSAKRRLETQFSGFSQLQVDTLLKTNSPNTALETAERYKNRTLTWLLDTWKEQTISPSWADMQTLLTPSTAAIFWHLSSDTLTTFLLSSDSADPQVISTASAEAFNQWNKDWQQRYQTYRKKSKATDDTDTERDRPNHPWRLNLSKDLQTLSEILNISRIETALTDCDYLILIPHRQLHQLPLHALFTDAFITTYLPSIQAGLTLQHKARQKSQSTSPPHPALLLETPASNRYEPLIFAEVETALIAYLCQQSDQQPTLIDSAQAHNQTLIATLQQPHCLFHFTGHAAHDYRHPQNSALALIGEDTLSAAEVATLPLKTYGLVTLAACETAVAGQENLETDYVGLSSAFLTAGAAQVISTLWTVDSQSNAWLMVNFYQRYLTGTSASLALHQAQQWLRTATYTQLADWLASLNTPSFCQHCTADEDETLVGKIGEYRDKSRDLDLSQTPYANPYYWAAFTLTGYHHESE